MAKVYVTSQQRILMNVSVDENGCWNWLKYKDKDGYGILGLSSIVKKRAHRFSYEAFKSKIPSGMLVMHNCDNRSCCNPNHLSVGTSLDNVRDMDSKGRRKTIVTKGESHSLAKLADADVLKIKKWPQYRGCVLDVAKHFGITRGLAKNLRKKANWKHLVNVE